MPRFIFSQGPALPASPKIEDMDDEVIIRDVLIMAQGPAKGHFAVVGEGDDEKRFQMMVDETTLSQLNDAATKYANGVKSKADHEGGVKQVMGYFTGLRIGQDKEGKPASRGDYHLLKTAPGFDHILKLFKKIADTIGFSAAFDGKPEIKEKFALTRVSELFSIDLVTEGAATPDGVFSVKVDKPGDGDPEHNMPPAQSPEEFAAACMAALKPHLEQIHSRLGALETRGQPTAQTSMAAQSGGVANPNEDDMYSRFSAKIKGEVRGVVVEEMQNAAKTLHAFGLKVGEGPGASAAGDGRGTPPKKIEDMTFNEVLELEFSKASNEAKTDSQIVREVTFAHPAKHRAALEKRELSRMPNRSHPYRAAARR